MIVEKGAGLDSSAPNLHQPGGPAHRPCRHRVTRPVFALSGEPLCTAWVPARKTHPSGGRSKSGSDLRVLFCYLSIPVGFFFVAWRRFEVAAGTCPRALRAW